MEISNLDIILTILSAVFGVFAAKLYLYE